MNAEESELQVRRRATVLTLEGQLIANGTIVFRSAEGWGEFYPEAGQLQREVPASQIAVSVVDGTTYRLKSFRRKERAAVHPQAATYLFERAA